MNEIYLDNAATTRPAEAVVDAMLPFLRDRFGNASSLHRRGVEAARAIEDARCEVAATLARDPREIVFTSGATESNNLALVGTARAHKRRGDHVIASAVEHPSVLEPLRALEKEGFRVSLAPVGRDGQLDLEALVALVCDRTILVSVMHVQNETGAIFPIDSLAARVKGIRKEIVFHSDGAQALGKLDAPSRNVELYSVSAHKIHGPQGVGALAVSKGTRLVPLQEGGGQESGLRPGTENLAAIVGLGVAARLAREGRVARMAGVSAVRERFLAGLRALDAVINSPEDAVATTVNASFPGAAAEVLLHALESRDVIVSSGSACSSKKSGHGRSHVLEAMGLPDELKKSALRFSFSRDTTADDVTRALAALRSALETVRTTRTRAGGR